MPGGLRRQAGDRLLLGKVGPLGNRLHRRSGRFDDPHDRQDAAPVAVERVVPQVDRGIENGAEAAAQRVALERGVAVAPRLVGEVGRGFGSVVDLRRHRVGDRLDLGKLEKVVGQKGTGAGPAVEIVRIRVRLPQHLADRVLRGRQDRVRVRILRVQNRIDRRINRRVDQAVDRKHRAGVPEIVVGRGHPLRDPGEIRIQGRIGDQEEIVVPARGGVAFDDGHALQQIHLAGSVDVQNQAEVGGVRRRRGQLRIGEFVGVRVAHRAGRFVDLVEGDLPHPESPGRMRPVDGCGDQEQPRKQGARTEKTGVHKRRDERRDSEEIR